MLNNRKFMFYYIYVNKILKDMKTLSEVLELMAVKANEGCFKNVEVHWDDDQNEESSGEEISFKWEMNYAMGVESRLWYLVEMMNFFIRVDWNKSYVIEMRDKLNKIAFVEEECLMIEDDWYDVFLTDCKKEMKLFLRMMEKIDNE